MGIWQQLDTLESRGKRTEKAGSMAGLHAKRFEHLSQFFTPEWVVSYIWQALAPSFKKDHFYSLLDNSIGAASMMRFATPDQFSISGLDIDSALVAKVAGVLGESGFAVDIVNAGMEEVELGYYSAAIINPPFSIPLSSPLLTPYAGVTHYGIHGPDSSALSHEYALAQALACTDVVAAIVPRSTTAKLHDLVDAASRLRAVCSLPNDTFRDENAQSVSADLLIFGAPLQDAAAKAPESVRVYRDHLSRDSKPAKLFQLHIKSIRCKPINVIGIQTSEPVITLPVTGDNRVVLRRAGRWIKPVYFCGATEARVKNALYRDTLSSSREHRYPRATKYKGQYQLNLDVLLLQNEPFVALEKVMENIRAAGGNPIVDHQLTVGIERLLKEHAAMSVPFGRTVYRVGAPTMSAVAKKTGLLNRTQRGAVVATGDKVEAKRTEAGFQIQSPRGVFDCDHDTFFDVFQVDDSASKNGYWEEIAPPIRETFPEAIGRIEQRAKALKLDRWLTWDFQREDLYELAFKPNGAICGWQMALGKTRLALALALLLPGTSLIIVKSRLIDELVREITTLNIGSSQYQVITSPTQALRKLNIVSYERLRNPLHSRAPAITLARRLKNRIHNIIADEGGLLANTLSQQTRSVTRLNAKRTYIFDGTPCPNYPREMLPLACHVADQSRSYQPYALGDRPFIAHHLFDTATSQPTGRNAFLDDYVQFEWATNEFLDSGKGARREVPKIKTQNIGQFRDWLAPIVKRRVQQEPAVQQHVKFPVPTLHAPIHCEWDFDHLKLYIQTVENFATWYLDYIEAQQEDKKGINLTLILAKLEACFKAANVPSTVSGFAKPFTHLTTKEVACIDLVVAEIQKGRRPIVFARNPRVLNRLANELDNRNISNLVFTGEETIARRIKKLNAGIREGDAQVMLASTGVTQDGLNLHQLDTFIFYNRSYKAREEFQAIYRLIRPQQKRDVYGYFLHLAGSIDDYMGQLIEWKTLASEAGLDYGDQPDDQDFSHFDTFIYRFIDSLPDLKAQLEHARKAA